MILSNVMHFIWDNVYLYRLTVLILVYMILPLKFQDGAFLVRPSIRSPTQPYVLMVVYHNDVKNIPIAVRASRGNKYALGTEKADEKVSFLISAKAIKFQIGMVSWFLWITMSIMTIIIQLIFIHITWLYLIILILFYLTNVCLTVAVPHT